MSTSRALHFPVREMSTGNKPAIERWVTDAPVGEWVCYHRSATLERFGPGIGNFMHKMCTAGLVALAQFRVKDGDFMYLARRTVPAVPKAEWHTRGPRA